jgi:micrococcal nuclease
MKYAKYIAVSFGMLGCYLLGYSHSISANPKVRLVSVHDGDTIIVDIVNWPPIIGHHIPIRVKGIDTPELNDKSARVRTLALKAKDFLSSKIGSSHIELRNIERDKYFRLDAEIYANGSNVGELLLAKGMAKRYDGGKKPDWK